MDPGDACLACDADATCDADAEDPCACPAGYVGDGTLAGSGCTDVDECAEGAEACVDAASGGTCTNSEGAYTCGCASGYVGDGTVAGSGCTDVDECADALDNCVDAVDGGTCVDVDGTFSCACANGYAGDGLVGGTGCANVDECADGLDDCVDDAAGGVCIDAIGSFACACAGGYAGDGVAAGTGCTNIDECADGLDDCIEDADGGSCTDAAGTFACACVEGYLGDGVASGTGCTNIDECTEALDDCVEGADGGLCTDAAGTYECACVAGYAGDGVVGGTGCSDVNECAAAQPACIVGACANEVGGFSCYGYVGTSPFQNLLWFVSPVDSTLMGSLSPSLPGFTITGTTAIRQDPTTGVVYAVAKVSGVTGRVLCTVDLSTGEYTQVGNLGDNFASIEFRDDGQLFGVTGNGSTVPETLYLIDKATGAKTLARTLGAGADGEVIVHNPDDGFFYHFSGNSTVVFEKIADTEPYDITSIPITGSTSGETFGAYYLGNGEILISNIGSSFNKINVNGTWGPLFGSLPDDLRGLSLVEFPSITVTPNVGPAAGGTVVTMNGRFAADVNNVTVAGQPATDVVVTANEVTFTTPAGSTGPATIVVRGPNAGSHTFANAFTYE